MSTRSIFLLLGQRSPGAALVIGLHLAVLASLMRPSPPPVQRSQDWSAAIRIIATPAPPRPPALPLLPRLLPASPERPAADSARHPSPAAAAPARPDSPASSGPALSDRAATATAAASAFTAAPAARSADDILLQARCDLGSIDRQLRSERPQGIVAPADTSQRRLDQAFDRAAAAAPGGLFEAPKVEEILDPGGYGRTRYRVVGATGTYCVTYESNRAPDGLDTMKNGIRPKTRTCPAFEQPPTVQQ
jgi:hypothetical protein